MCLVVRLCASVCVADAYVKAGGWSGTSMQ